MKTNDLRKFYELLSSKAVEIYDSMTVESFNSNYTKRRDEALKIIEEHRSKGYGGLDEVLSIDMYRSSFVIEFSDEDIKEYGLDGFEFYLYINSKFMHSDYIDKKDDLYMYISFKFLGYDIILYKIEDDKKSEYNNFVIGYNKIEYLNRRRDFIIADKKFGDYLIGKSTIVIDGFRDSVKCYSIMNVELGIDNIPTDDLVSFGLNNDISISVELSSSKIMDHIYNNNNNNNLVYYYKNSRVVPEDYYLRPENYVGIDTLSILKECIKQDNSRPIIKPLVVAE